MSLYAHLEALNEEIVGELCSRSRDKEADQLTEETRPEVKPIAGEHYP